MLIKGSRSVTILQSHYGNYSYGLPYISYTRTQTWTQMLEIIAYIRTLFAKLRASAYD